MNNLKFIQSEINSNEQNLNNNNFKKNMEKQNENNIYPYINCKKIKITFINQKNERKDVLIPFSLTNNELYYTADKIKILKLYILIP